jgi:hypothetical protein
MATQEPSKISAQTSQPHPEELNTSNLNRKTERKYHEDTAHYEEADSKTSNQPTANQMQTLSNKEQPQNSKSKFTSPMDLFSTEDTTLVFCPNLQITTTKIPTQAFPEQDKLGQPGKNQFPSQNLTLHTAISMETPSALNKPRQTPNKFLTPQQDRSTPAQLENRKGHRKEICNGNAMTAPFAAHHAQDSQQKRRHNCPNIASTKELDLTDAQITKDTPNNNHRIQKLIPHNQIILFSSNSFAILSIP